jgi:hypothetical protein
MRKLVSGLAVAVIVALVVPAWAQGVTTQGQPSGQNAPGTAGTSKAGVPGLPGSKSGPTVIPSGNTVPDARNHQSGVPGVPGNKSGPVVNPPASGR